MEILELRNAKVFSELRLNDRNCVQDIFTGNDIYGTYSAYLQYSITQALQYSTMGKRLQRNGFARIEYWKNIVLRAYAGFARVSLAAIRGSMRQVTRGERVYRNI